MREFDLFGGYPERTVGFINSATDYIGRLGMTMDIDGTDANSQKPAVDKFNMFHGTQYTIADLQLSKFQMLEWAKKFGMNEKESLEHSIQFWNSPEALADHIPEGGAVELSYFMHSRGIDIHRISARPGYTLEGTIGFYKKYMPWLVRDNLDLIHLQPSGDTINPKFKVDWVRANKLGFHLDDDITDAVNIAALGVTVGIVPQPWNEGYISDNPGILTLDSAINFGLPTLGINSDRFCKLPKLIQVYLNMTESSLHTW